MLNSMRQLLETAGTFLLFPDVWAQYALAYDGHGFEVNPYSPAAVHWDATAAIAVIAGLDEVAMTDSAYDTLEDYLGTSIDKFNDYPLQTAEVVASALLEAAHGY